VSVRILFLLSTAITQDSPQVTLRTMDRILERLRRRGHTADMLSIIPETDAASQRKFSLYKTQQWDVILSVYSSWYVHVDGVREILGNQSDCLVGFLSTEYDLRPHGVYEPWDFFCTNHIEENYRHKTKKYQDYRMLNLNAVIADEYRPSRLVERSQGILYYGRYRAGRARYCSRYFDSRLAVSTSKKNVSKFSGDGCAPRWYQPIDWSPGRETLRSFYCSLYLEDEATHTIYSHLGARFYEALLCGTVPLFDVSCMHTIDRSGYEIPSEWIVRTVDELHVRVQEIREDWERHSAIVARLSQQAAQERDQVLDDLGEYLEHLRGRVTPRRLSGSLVRDASAVQVPSPG
jgi:hypothetical protein